MSCNNNSKPSEQRVNLPYLTLSGVSAPRQGIPIIHEDPVKVSISSSTSSLGTNPNSFVNSYVNMNKLHQLHESESAPNLLPLINQEKAKSKPVPVVVKTDVHTSISLINNSKLASHNLKKRFSDITQLESISKINEEKNSKLKEFELLQTIGTGTFGRVMLTKNSFTGDYYALKIMSIPEVIRLKQIEHVKNEKLILSTIKPHPFIVRLLWTHHNNQFLYMLMEYLPGGEMYTLLKQKQKFDVKSAIFYTAEIVCALEYLHSMQIGYRDLKPENILLDRDGHLKLTDFGFSKKIVNKTYTMCGTPEYLAPEIILLKGHDLTSDWWSLGILIYEFLAGSPPFYEDNRTKVYEKILMGKFEWPRHFDSVSRDIIKKLLNPDPTKRLGSGNCGLVKSTLALKENELNESVNGVVFLTEPDLTLPDIDAAESIASSSNSKTNSNDSLFSESGFNFKRSKINMGTEEVKRHRWFISITNWNEVYEKKLLPPFLPEVSHPGDTRNFDHLETPDLTKAPTATDKQLDYFYNF